MQAETTYERRKDYVVYDYSGVFKRLLGRLMDIILLLAASKLLIMKGIGTGTAVVYIIAEYFYSILLIYFFGQTIGMWIVGAKAISTTGKRISFGRAALRAITGKLSEYLFWLGNIWMLFNDSYQTWQDKLSCTIVINKQSAEAINSYIGRHPWEKRRSIKVLSVITVSIGICIILFSSLQQLVYDFGRLGIARIGTFDTKLQILAVRGRTLENGQYIFTGLCANGENLVLQEYTLDNGKMKVSKEMNLEGTMRKPGLMSMNYDIEDLDGDGKTELILSTIYAYDEDSSGELLILKSDNSTYKVTSRITENMKNEGAFQSNVMVLGKEHKILWVNNQEISLLKYDGKSIHQGIKSFLPTNNTALIKADFEGSGVEKVYVVQQSKNSLEISALDLEGKLNLKSLGEMSDKIQYMSELYNGHIMAGDINNDNKDELIFSGMKDEDSSSAKEDDWLNVYSVRDNKWSKIWSGGNIPSALRDKYKSTGDVNQDGRNDIIMVKGAEIKTYEYEPFYFRLNTLLHQVNEFTDRTFRLWDE